MDPLACLERLQRSIADKDYSDAVAALNEYYQWRLKGGFQPLNGDAVANTLAYCLADALG